MIRSETPVEALMIPNPVTVGPSDSVNDALKLLERHPFRHLPVVELNRVVGIVSDRDLALAGALPRGARAPGHGPRRARSVAEIMRRPVHTVGPSDTAYTAVALLLVHRIGALPVVAADEIVGIATETDFLRLFLGGGCPRIDAPEAARVGDCMSSPVLTTDPGEDLLQAAERLLASSVRHLPVVEDRKLLGMLSDRDVRRGLARLVRADRRLEQAASAEIPLLRVGQVMSRPCATIERDRPLRSAAYAMVENRIGALVVLDGDEMVGVISQRDLLERFLDWSEFQV